MRTLTMLALAPLAIGAEYTIAPVPQTEFRLEVHKTGLMSGKVHVFTYEKYSGLLSFSEGSPEQASVSFTVDNSSIVCRDTWVNEKDKQKIVTVAHESMETEKHPSMSFQSQSISRRSDGGFDVTGRLTIKGIGKPITLKVSMSAEGRNVRFKGEGAIRRKDYGINPRAAIPFGLIGNKEEMPVRFDLVASPK